MQNDAKLDPESSKAIKKERTAVSWSFWRVKIDIVIGRLDIGTVWTKLGASAFLGSLHFTSASTSCLLLVRIESHTMTTIIFAYSKSFVSLEQAKSINLGRSRKCPPLGPK